MSETPWRSGAPIVIREVWEGRIWTARPVTVIQDTSELIALWMAPGTRYAYPQLPDGRPIPHMLPDQWALFERPWLGGGALYLTRPGDWYVLIGFFNDDNSAIQSWYVNLQTPYVRTPIGFDYLDQELDLVVSPDLRSWRWKDEEGFAELQRRDRISAAHAQHIRAVGEELMGQLARGEITLPLQWQDWRPPSGWEIPTLPAGWDTLGTPQG